MRQLIVFLTIFSFTLTAHAGLNLDSISKEEIATELNTDLSQVAQEVNEASDCLEQYRHRRNVLIGQAIGLPVGYPFGTFGIMYVAAMIDKFLNPGTFLPGLAGAAYGFLIGSAIFVTYETVTIVKLSRTISMLNLIKHLRSDQPDKLARLQSFYKRVRRKLHKTPEQLPDSAIFARLSELDQKGAFCDATLVSHRRQKKFSKRGKMKDALAYKSDVVKAL
ncbi:MAG: hypothetical protein A2X86_17195 [Bdellovibrionales bacterium GWA2_49_15]|nr:MAG: hypothetical protein A2X86_17195 [Bdellovibrionales bacterium GWA2_49_15]HAZ14025.1 hypothetical protein [Bdellovibrionales bacterium]